ncbi:MAG: ABC transporter permease [Bauldia sp.]|uniref:ABC transporter permease n=1 Tax=Bauldia sp. TaxID=2575872 RepID=UPI001D64DB8F|nr:ABC transporter permease [Bauldia sp.]MCB1494351.1 ABC transporter permease [Bauldia sp.]
MKRILANENTVRLMILLTLVVLFGILTDGASTSLSNLTNVLVQSAIRGIAACGQALVIMSAGLDLAVSGIVSVSLMLGAGLVTANPELNLLGYQLPVVVVFPVMLLVAAAFGLLNGVLVAGLRIPALLATLGVWQISEGLAYKLTGKGYVDGISESIGAIATTDVLFLPLPVVILFLVVAATHVVLGHTTFGRELYAVGGNDRSAVISGVRVSWIRCSVYGIAGLLYGICAILSLAHYQGATMAQASGLELETIAAVAIGGVSLSGGKGTIVGVILGVLIVSVIGNALNILGAGPTYQNVVKGGLLILVVALDTAVARRLVLQMLGFFAGRRAQQDQR